MEILFGILTIIGIIFVGVIALVALWTWTQCRVIEEECRYNNLRKNLKNKR